MQDVFQPQLPGEPQYAILGPGLLPGTQGRFLFKKPEHILPNNCRLALKPRPVRPAFQSVVLASRTL